MLDEFDYKEPLCPLTGGKEHYYPNKDAPLGHIPVDRIISKVDALFDKNDYTEAGRLLEYWRDEAIALRDKRGELAVQSELVGYYRKQNEREKGLASIIRALELVDELSQAEMASGATVYINCATAYKALGMPEKALPLYVKAEKIYKYVLEDGDSRFGGLYNNMALTLAGLELYEEAEKAFYSALSVMGNIVGGEPECAITYINLAHMYENSNKKEKIAECINKAKELLTKEGISHDGYYAFVLEKCAPSFGYFGDVETYEDFMKLAEKIYAGT